MEAYLFFHSGRAHEVACAEQEEDIGSPSDSESPSTSTSRESAGSSSELDDDASSSGSDRFEMSALMTQLPLKRGLSRFFDGKSQSFASVAAVGSLEDLAKPARKRLKPSRSCGGALDAHRGRLLSPRRHWTKPAAASGARKTAARSGGLSVLTAVAPRMPPPVRGLRTWPPRFSSLIEPRISLPELDIDARCRRHSYASAHPPVPELIVFSSVSQCVCDPFCNENPQL
ncbi:OSJNBa0088A01.13-like protein [Zea mays]|uniref:OSJNBa0088A01.13-like protein n=1 Tax=Zea mays TaxID=4577 RepID=A0A1D6Q729_MAIZE|nr:OSJNBa0088A01.13-like protein [Zea mays]